MTASQWSALLLGMATSAMFMLILSTCSPIPVAAQEAPINFKPGDPVRVHAYCNDDPASPGEMTNGMKIVIAALKARDPDIYTDQMMDPDSGCVDFRMFGMPQVPATLIALDHKFVMRDPDTGEGLCYAIWSFRFSDESEAHSWLVCNTN